VDLAAGFPLGFKIFCSCSLRASSLELAGVAVEILIPVVRSLARDEGVEPLLLFSAHRRVGDFNNFSGGGQSVTWSKQ
jgi:hypothetical protein